MASAKPDSVVATWWRFYRRLASVWNGGIPKNR